jgi:hypothetical protein
VLSTNLHRRHLTDDQRGAISMQTLPLLEAEARERQGRRTDREPLGENAQKFTPRSRTQAAEQFHVSEYKVRQAKAVAEADPAVLETGVPATLSGHPKQNR